VGEGWGGGGLHGQEGGLWGAASEGEGGLWTGEGALQLQVRLPGAADEGEGGPFMEKEGGRAPGEGIGEQAPASLHMNPPPLLAWRQPHA
jgi:hypothetical protein